MANPQGIVQTDSINKTAGRHVHSRSHFPDSLSYRNALTMRFGEYVPTFLMEGVPNDKISVNTHDLVDSMSLKAPFKGTIRKIKESFKVPNMAILPMNWDLIYTQPSNGDDVPSDVNCVLENFPALFTKHFENMYDVMHSVFHGITSSSTDADIVNALNILLRTMVLGEYVFSNGSLLNVSGYHSAGWIRWYKPLPNASFEQNSVGATFDEWFDYVISVIFSKIKFFNVTEISGGSALTYRIRGLSASGESATDNADMCAPFRFFMEKLRENPTISISGFSLQSATTAGTFRTALAALAAEDDSQAAVLDKHWQFYLPLDQSGSMYDFTDRSPCNLNLSRILAYQLVCAHYYSNSSIDFIYSAELYRQYIYQLYRSQTTQAKNSRSFSRNGAALTYDFLSEQYLARLLYLAPTASQTSPQYVVSNLRIIDAAGLTDSTDGRYQSNMNMLAAWAAIFGFRKSLRFGDYFVGSRPRPIAPINTDAPVVSQHVSVIDITRGIQAQRFGNAVMRSRQKIEEYVGSLFGNTPAPDYHNPFFLSRETETIFGDEVQNTGVAQQQNANSRTANFASNMGRFTFTFHNDDAHPCIYLQIVSFDVKRHYTRSVERQFLALDRYDMFNPDFQYIGDQPVYGVELGYSNFGNFPRIFGYQSRDMEYKQRFDQASGGFVVHLPGWIMTDRSRELYQPDTLNPDFIRSFSVELDPFYLSLTGHSLASYFHFAVIVDNNVDAVRPMAVDPQILE